VRALLKRYHLRPDRRRGQNFLIDEAVYDDMLAAAELAPRATVLEVGAGLGTLTERLAARAGQVVAVEVDPRLARLLRARFATQANVAVVQADILRRPPATLGLATPYQVANIPYYLTSALLKLLLTGAAQPTSLTLLVQREVAERIVAAPGAMSLLALSVQLYGQPRLVRTVSPDAFLPPPEVASALLAVRGLRRFPFTDVPEQRFWQVARVGFAAKRKQLVNNLAGGLRLPRAAAAAALETAGIAATARAEDLSLTAWRALVRALPA
jgi:16S rRNA (adenine1518-N6/adenine1519-N6)-dimethyltransferase